MNAGKICDEAKGAKAMTKSLVLRLLVFLSLLACAPAFAQHETEMHEGQQVAARSVLVKFKVSAASQALQQLRRSQDIDAEKAIGGIEVHRFRSRTKSVAALLVHFSARA